MAITSRLGLGQADSGETDLAVSYALWAILFLLIPIILSRRRTSAFRRRASSLGLEYRHGPFALADFPIPLFQRGTARGVSEVMLGRWKGDEVIVVDYWYRPTYLPSATERTYLCVLVKLSSRCPPTEIEHESAAGLLADLVAHQRVMTNSEAFNKRYRVQSADREFANLLLAPSVVDFLVQSDWSALHYELGGMYAACASSDRDIGLVPRMLELAREFGSRIPAMADREKVAAAAMVRRAASAAPLTVTLDHTKVRPRQFVIAAIHLSDHGLPRAGEQVTLSVGAVTIGSAMTDAGGVARIGFAAPPDEGDAAVVVRADGVSGRAALMVAK